jgi:hypothetical protein
MSICLFASELAILTKHNKYQKLHEFVLKLWQRNFPQDFKNSLKLIEESKKIKFVPEKTEKEVIEEFSKKRKLNIKKEVDVQNVNDLNKNKQKIIKKVETQNKEIKNEITNFINNIDTLKLDKKKLEETKNSIIKKFNDETKKEVKKLLKNVDKIKENKQQVIKKIDNSCKKEKEILKKNLESFSNTNFGIKKENSVVGLFQEKRGERVIIDTKFYKKLLFNHNNIKWYVGGRVDGYLEDGTIIEIKNRIYKLFYRLRDYERIQIQTYMYIFDTTKGILVESIRGKLNIIDVEFNEESYQDIKEKIKSFSNFFNNFISNIKQKTILLMGTEREKENLCTF